MKNLGQFEISRFDTAITDDNHPGGTALIAESAAQDSKMTLIMPSMSVSQIVTCLLASAQESRYDNMSLIDVEAEYRKATQPAAMPEILRIKIDYEKKCSFSMQEAGCYTFDFQRLYSTKRDFVFGIWLQHPPHLQPSALKNRPLHEENGLGCHEALPTPNEYFSACRPGETLTYCFPFN